MFRTLG
jgi:hypothetical protein